MARVVLGEFRLGEDVAIALDAIAGDPSTVTAITAAMRQVVGPPFTSQPIVFREASALPMVATSRGADGWTLSLPAAVTATLASGFYAVDARMEIGGGVEITETSAVISLTQAAVS